VISTLALYNMLVCWLSQNFDIPGPLLIFERIEQAQPNQILRNLMIDAW
jgi:hypothetical protein